MFRIAIVSAMLAFGGCELWEDGGASIEAKLHISEIEEQKAGIEFSFSMEIQIDGETVTTGDNANTEVTVQWKCGEEKYTDENKVEAEIKDGKVEVKITIGEVDDLEDRTDCKIKAVAQINDTKIEIESQVFVVKAQAIKIALTEGTVLGAALSDAITSIKSDERDVPLNEATVSLSEGCRDVRLVRWPSSAEADNAPAEVEDSPADAEDIYLATNKKKVDTNCILVVSTDAGKKHGAVPLAEQEADYSIASVHEPTKGQLQIDLQEDEKETGGNLDYKLYLVYNNDDTLKNWYKPGSGGLGMSGGTVTLKLSKKDNEDNSVDKVLSIPDSFYYKIEDRVLFWVYEPTIVKEIVARKDEGKDEGKLFSVKYLSEGDKLTLENITEKEKCDASLYQVTMEEAASYSVGAETYPSITTAISAGQIKQANNLFVIGNSEHCELRLNDKAIGSFASDTDKGSGATVGVEKTADSKVKVTANDATAVFVLSDSDYVHVQVDSDNGNNYTSTVESGEVDTALVRVRTNRGNWLWRVQRKEGM